MGYENSAGLGVRNHYGPKAIKDFGGQVSTSGMEKELSIVFDWDDLPVVSLLDMEPQIPAGSYIKSAQLEVLEAMTGTLGTWDIGLYEPDGTVVDLDGIDVAVAQAALVADAWIACDGALIGTGIGVDSQVVVAEGGTVTAGKARLIIEYIQGDVDGTGNYVAGGVKGA